MLFSSILILTASNLLIKEYSLLVAIALAVYFLGKIEISNINSQKSTTIFIRYFLSWIFVCGCTYVLQTILCSQAFIIHLISRFGIESSRCTQGYINLIIGLEYILSVLPISTYLMSFFQGRQSRFEDNQRNINPKPINYIGRYLFFIVLLISISIIRILIIR